MIPQPLVHNRKAIATRLDDITGYGFTVYGLDGDPREKMSAPQIAAWENVGARFVVVVGSSGSTLDVADSGEVEAVIDHTQALRKWMSKFKSTVVVVRPDHFVCASDTSGLDVPTFAVA